MKVNSLLNLKIFDTNIVEVNKINFKFLKFELSPKNILNINYITKHSFFISITYNDFVQIYIII
ncbi:hypothetical protein EF514_01635 [Anaerosphaera multitolerans]|uniref:Uncharacterized protein n=1 Tax=Anaerosphaera multitolerans TaxID=2487351 RepID=A0A437S8N6_9FIRM|nr:hypothetical protein EF514_01635 [Anaerosphaera multitolerans]